MQESLDGPIRVPTGAWVRLPRERWRHIEKCHPEVEAYRRDMATALESPDKILEGDAGARMAVHRLTHGEHVHKLLVVVYREVTETDGFVVTAYIARRLSPEWRVIWQA